MFPTVAETLGEVCNCRRELCWRQLGLKPHNPYLLHALCQSEYFLNKPRIDILCLWFRASLIYTNNCPTRCNKKQSIYYSASSLYMFRVSTTPIIKNTQNCKYNLQYWSNFLCAATSLQRGQVGHVLLYLWPSWPRCVVCRWIFINIVLIFGY